MLKVYRCTLRRDRAFLSPRGASALSSNNSNVQYEHWAKRSSHCGCIVPVSYGEVDGTAGD